jgi:predicted DNA-binding transcriptional regulator AlpA
MTQAAVKTQRAAGGSLQKPRNQSDRRASTMSQDTTILTVHQVCERLTISEPTLRRYAKAGGDFPPKIQLGPRRVGYLASDLERYITSRHTAARGAVNA